jgi:ribose 5-phosphate isomerase B|tara:strand:+ start:79 stop:921 length:843 start_codon:yes stop_codon:yes gene_type:complete
LTNIILGSDHNGIELKKIIKEYLLEKKFNPIDIGPFNTNKVDYPDYASQVAKIIASGDADFGILICGTGIGMSIVANKVAGIRAALVHNLQTAPLTKEHNNANILCLGAWVVSSEVSLQIVDSWLTAKFGEYRHVKRVAKIDVNPTNKIVFTNGVFDLVHSGHVELLNFAKTLGDKLVVGLNSDNSTRLLKGNKRPINKEEDRKNIIQSLRAVDEVIVFDSIDTTDLINNLNPDIIVKGGEWTVEEVRERDKIPDNIEVYVYPFKEGYSSTNIINMIKET